MLNNKGLSVHFRAQLKGFESIQEMGEKIYAFQCIYCLEKFDIISPNLEDRLLFHYYNLHGDNKPELIVEPITTSFIDGEEYIEQQDTKDKVEEEYSRPLTEELEDTSEFEVLADGSEYIKYYRTDQIDSIICEKVEEVEYLDEALDFLRLEKPMTVTEPIVYEGDVEELFLNEGDDNFLAEQQITSEKEPKKLGSNLIGCVRKIYTNKSFFEKLTNNKSSTSILDEELENMIRTVEDGSYECTFCAKLFKVRSKLKEHLLYHYPPQHQCTICQKTFYRARNWRYHMTKHSDTEIGMPSLKPRKMPDLNKCYYGLPNSGDPSKPWKCSSCEKMFTSPSSLKAHYDRHHTISKRKDFICHICGKNLSNKMALNDHLKVHEGIKDFECDICGLRFAHKNMVRVHMIRHKTENSYKCDICPATYKSWRSLDYHKKRHSGGGNLSCEFCGKKFILSIHLKYHRSMHTGKFITALV